MRSPLQPEIYITLKLALYLNTFLFQQCHLYKMGAIQNLNLARVLILAPG